MPPPGSFLAFLATVTVLMLTPGPAVVFVVTRSIDQGRLAGLASVAGICLGDLVHVVAVVIGLTGLFAASPVAFNVVKYLGAAYLVYLGVRRLLQPATLPDAKPEKQTVRQLLRQGVMVSILNPKDALFFLALLPQFAAPEQGAIALQLFLLGMTFVVMAALIDGAYALGGAGLGRLLKTSATVRNAQRWVVGAIYIALGAFAATASI